MSNINFKKCGIASALLLLTGTAAQAATLWVNCGARNGLNSIGAALNPPGPESHGPNTINVSGACRENILIKDTDLLTNVGGNRASITYASGGISDVVDTRGSRVTIIEMTIDSLSSVNFDAVDCGQASQCRLIGTTMQGGADAVRVYALSSALIVVGGVIPIFRGMR